MKYFFHKASSIKRYKRKKNEANFQPSWPKKLSLSLPDQEGDPEREG